MLPEYGPLAPTEDSLGLLDSKTDLCALELGCGSGTHSVFCRTRRAGTLGLGSVSGSNCVCPGDAPSVCVEGSAHRIPNGSESRHSAGSL